jgi:hypothetical protein
MLYSELFMQKVAFTLVTKNCYCNILLKSKYVTNLNAATIYSMTGFTKHSLWVIKYSPAFLHEPILRFAGKRAIKEKLERQMEVMSIQVSNMDA